MPSVANNLTSSSSGNPTIVEHRITQAGNNFSVGDPLYLDQGVTRSFDDSNVTVSNNQIAISSHGLVSNERIQLTDGGASLPTGLATGIDYYIRYISSGIIQLSATSGNVLENTAADTAFTDNGGNLNINMVGHGYSNDDEIYFVSDDTLPTGITSATPYYVNVVDVDNFEISDVPSIPGPLNIITFTDAGTGNHTAYRPIGTPVDITGIAAATGHGVVPQDLGLYKIADGTDIKQPRYIVTSVNGSEFTIAQTGSITAAGKGPFTAGADYYVSAASVTTGLGSGTFSTTENGNPFLEGRGNNDAFILSSGGGGSSAGGGSAATIQYIQPPSTDGGSAPNGVQTTYPLNTITDDPDGVITSFVSSEFTLNGSGSYSFNFIGTGYQLGNPQFILHNITTATDLILGTTGFTSLTSDVSLTMSLVGSIPYNGTDTLALQYIAINPSGGANNLGVATTNGNDEVYGILQITKNS